MHIKIFQGFIKVCVLDKITHVFQTFLYQHTCSLIYYSICFFSPLTQWSRSHCLTPRKHEYRQMERKPSERTWLGAVGTGPWAEVSEHGLSRKGRACHPLHCLQRFVAMQGWGDPRMRTINRHCHLCHLSSLNIILSLWAVQSAVCKVGWGPGRPQCRKRMASRMIWLCFCEFNKYLW